MPGRAPKILVAQAVGVALQREDLGVVHEPVDHGRRNDVIAEDLSHAENGLFEVTINDARS